MGDLAQATQMLAEGRTRQRLGTTLLYRAEPIDALLSIDAELREAVEPDLATLYGRARIDLGAPTRRDGGGRGVVEDALPDRRGGQSHDLICRSSRYMGLAPYVMRRSAARWLGGSGGTPGGGSWLEHPDERLHRQREKKREPEVAVTALCLSWGNPDGGAITVKYKFAIASEL